MFASALEVVGYLGALFSVATYAMRTMVSLRILAICSNIFSAAYGFMMDIYPMLILHVIVLPLNVWRLHEMRDLVRKVKKSASEGFDMKWLKPFMTSEKVFKEHVVFHKGDTADAMYLIVSGKFVLAESGIQLTDGALVGEFGLFSPDNARTQTLVCKHDGTLLKITYEHFRELYFQNPEFGYYFLQLTTRRLFENIHKLEKNASGQVVKAVEGEIA